MALTTNIYRLTSARFQGGAIYVCYRDSIFSGLDLADANLTVEQVDYLLRTVPPLEEELMHVKMGTMKAQLIPAKSAKEKLILFAQHYKTHRGVTYVATQTERSNIRTVPVTTDLLNVFFRESLSNFSIANYISRINITKDRLRNGTERQVRMPDYYDAKYEATLVGNQVIEYHRHLIKLGWQKLTGGPAGTVWKAPKRTTQ